jgi:hypothetical protein
VSDFTYTTTFSLAGLNPSTANIDVTYLLADDETAVYLNGTLEHTSPLDSNNGAWAVPDSFDITSGFVGGTNTLTFVTPNSGGPGGLQVQMSGTAAVPEASTLTLLGGLVAPAGMLIRRRIARR